MPLAVTQVCAVCQAACAPQLVTRVLAQGKRRALCPACHERWLDQKLDLDKLDLDAKPIKAQATLEATVQARVQARVRLSLFVLHSGRNGALFSLSPAPRSR